MNCFESFNSPLYDTPKKRIVKIYVNSQSHSNDDILYYINKYINEIEEKNLDFEFEGDYSEYNNPRVQLYGYDNNLLLDFEFHDPNKMFKDLFKKINNLNIYKVEKDIKKRMIIERNRIMLNEIINNKSF
jgi:hypothetical protein